MICVLDASAMIAFLRDEFGAQVAAAALLDPDIDLAQRLGAPILTADHHEFDALVEQSVCAVQFIR